MLPSPPGNGKLNDSQDTIYTIPTKLQMDDQTDVSSMSETGEPNERNMSLDLSDMESIDETTRRIQLLSPEVPPKLREFSPSPECEKEKRVSFSIQSPDGSKDIDEEMQLADTIPTNNIDMQLLDIGENNHDQGGRRDYEPIHPGRHKPEEI